MTLYTYSAQDRRTGGRMTGTVEAGTKADALKQLEAGGMRDVSVEDVAANSPSSETKGAPVSPAPSVPAKAISNGVARAFQRLGVLLFITGLVLFLTGFWFSFVVCIIGMALFAAGARRSR